MTGALPTELRKQLEGAIQEARRVAEPGARRALEALAVDRARAHASMSAAEQALRKRLRAHGRQLGDARDPEKETQETRRLAREVAYEHWHRMLFARFLAENQLLIEPQSGVPISMAECKELARERGEDPWATASRAAARMLPRIFRPDDPALEVALAPETRQKLERLLEALPAEVFTADDSLGWTYQFWQAERKDEVNASGVKIGADELPAVTQLFTEHYMVLFLFHNTIGAWRAGKLLAERPELAQSAASEDELRRAVRLDAEGGYDFDYLRFVREPQDGDNEGEPTGPWRPAAGAFEGWPRKVAELRVLDPCCGSGHFLVEGLGLLVRLRMEEEGLARDDAIRAALAENLFGLELDPRCTQIAAFNLALAAWKLAGRPIELPPLQIACSGLAIGASKREWLALAGPDTKLRAGMEWLYELFEKAPELGSLVDPRASARDMRQMNYDVMKPLLGTALERESDDAEQVERAVTARGMARAAEFLAGAYTLVITNVPFLGRKDQSASLARWIASNFSRAKKDLATAMVDRIQRLLSSSGTLAIVTPQNWLFLTGYTPFRRHMLNSHRWRMLANLGEEAWTTYGNRGPRTSLLVLSRLDDSDGDGFCGIEASTTRGEHVLSMSDKMAILRGRTDGFAEASPIRAHMALRMLSQQECLEDPDAAVLMARQEGRVRLGHIASCYQGISTGDSPRFLVHMWEIEGNRDEWAFLHGPPSCEEPYSGRDQVIRREATDSATATGAVRGRSAWHRRGIAVAQTGGLRPTVYTGDFFPNSVPVIVPHRECDLEPLWRFCNSGEYERALRSRNSKVAVDNGYVEKIVCDIEHWRSRQAEADDAVLPSPSSNDPTQWLFHGHPAKAEPEAALQVAVARLLGYRWPPEHDAEMRLADEARAWVARCGELAGFADDDGIVCLPALRGEAGAADRLRRLLAAAFGGAWSGAKERELLAAAAGDGKAAESLEEWLRERFFEEHCKRFHHRPFVWHVWDGRRDGFHALVAYHRLAGPGGEGRRTLEALTYSYLGDWIARQKAEQREGREGADACLAAAQDLQAQLARILEGEPPCDLFVRWKPLHRQPIGWEPDIDDGVRLNIRPFLRAELRTGGRKGAGLLRWKPNLKWSKDRGKEPQSLRPREDFPWFWSCPGAGSETDRTDFEGGPDFDGNRWNDLHYTTAAKRAARERAGGGAAT